ncbi:hypothetical protein E2L08_14330, partial [Palleronia sediminis]
MSLRSIRLFCAAFGLGAMLAAGASARDLGPEDLRALRYYLEQNDMRSAQAELRRLKEAYPDWTPPSDLDALKRQAAAPTGPGEDANRIWRLIEIGNLQAARGRLQHLQTVYPDWTPPAEMVRLLEAGEAQASFDAAMRSGNATAAIDAARKSPEILKCDRVNNAWQLAAMQVQAGQSAGALQTYRGVLSSCRETNVLVATLEKANDIASTEQVGQLADIARRTSPSAARSIDTVEARLMAGRGAPAPARTDTAQAPARQAGTPAAQSRPAPAAPVTAAPQAP